MQVQASNYFQQQQRLSYAAESHRDRKRSLVDALQLKDGVTPPFLLRCAGCGRSAVSCGECLLESAVSDQRREMTGARVGSLHDEVKDDGEIKERRPWNSLPLARPGCHFQTRSEGVTAKWPSVDAPGEKFDLQAFMKEPGDGSRLAVHGECVRRRWRRQRWRRVGVCRWSWSLVVLRLQIQCLSSLHIY